MGEITEVSGNLFKGYIKTDSCVIRWDYDEGQDCCEHAEAVLSCGDDLSEMVGKSISQEIDLVKVEDIENQYDAGGAWRLVLNSENYLEFSNSHNGYYSHNLDVTIDFVDDNKELINWNTSI